MPFQKPDAVDQHIISILEQNGRATDSLTLRNPSGVPRRFYVAIISASKTSLNSSYSLSFSARR